MSDRDQAQATGADAGAGDNSAAIDAGTVGAANDSRTTANTDALTAGAAARGAASRLGNLPNTSTNPRQGAAPAWNAEDARLRDFALIEPGWNVVGSDGDQLGVVAEKGPGWFSLHYGTSGERTMYIPHEYIETVAGTRVILSQPAPLLLDMKLDEPPPDNPGFEHERVGGTPHDPRRGDTGERVAIPEPVDQPAQAPMPPAADLTRRAGGAAGRSGSGSPIVQAAAGSRVPVGGERNEAGMRIPGRPAPAYAAEAHVEPTLDGDLVSEAETDPLLRSGVSTHMEPTVIGEHPEGWDRVNAQETLGQSFEERSGYRVFTDEQRLDRNDGPTHQPGVMDPHSLAPLRTQFGETGAPGAGKERNVTDLDLVKNQHPGGSPFDTQASTVGRPLAPGEPSAAQRSVEGSAGLPVPPEARPHDVPPGAVSRPVPKLDGE